MNKNKLEDPFICLPTLPSHRRPCPQAPPIRLACMLFLRVYLYYLCVKLVLWVGFLASHHGSSLLQSPPQYGLSWASQINFARKAPHEKFDAVETKAALLTRSDLLARKSYRFCSRDRSLRVGQRFEQPFALSDCKPQQGLCWIFHVPALARPHGRPCRWG